PAENSSHSTINRMTIFANGVCAEISLMNLLSRASPPVLLIVYTLNLTFIFNSINPTPLA
ncbi:MAG: hypothetical protein L3J26_13785, partial [Candidatus Polarisedimenticolaceae bacterium]|nr:hypothetical protein [Candidatus Polarisedimenticolaceae bacterium]